MDRAGHAAPAQSRARAVARGILSQPNPAVWAPALDAQIRAEFPGLVAGEATWKEDEVTA